MDSKFVSYIWNFPISCVLVWPSWPLSLQFQCPKLRKRLLFLSFSPETSMIELWWKSFFPSLPFLYLSVELGKKMSDSRFLDRERFFYPPKMRERGKCLFPFFDDRPGKSLDKETEKANNFTFISNSSLEITICSFQDMFISNLWQFLILFLVLIRQKFAGISLNQDVFSIPVVNSKHFWIWHMDCTGNHRRNTSPDDCHATVLSSNTKKTDKYLKNHRRLQCSITSHKTHFCKVYRQLQFLNKDQLAFV